MIEKTSASAMSSFATIIPTLTGPKSKNALFSGKKALFAILTPLTAISASAVTPTGRMAFFNSGPERTNARNAILTA
ncbi:MAG TPA: hypothetical protein PKL75_07705 [Treponemataceae bacterium]|nr:hypothetical protein [Treponemataceae bacterium]